VDALLGPIATRGPAYGSGYTPAAPGSSGIRFRDASDSSGITFVHCSGKTLEKLSPTANGSGVAMIDYDGDGWPDLYFPTTCHLPVGSASSSQGNRLYRNRRDGTFEDVTERAGVGFRGFTNGVVVGDVDNNGFPDLYLANLGGNVLYLNNGDGTFRDASKGCGAQCGGWSMGGAFLDYDRDGKLDLYVTSYSEWDDRAEHPACGFPDRGIRTYCTPRSLTPVRHHLFHNLGGARFEDVTERAGVLRKDGRGMGVIACDVNLDGWPDLYVANDLCPHFLFVNQRNGRFADESEASGASVSEAGHEQAGMGVDAEDLNGDGFPEIIVTHYREDYATLYRNLDGLHFQDVSARAGIVKDCLPNVGWGCALADFDQDGMLDLLIVNGHVDDNLTELEGPEVTEEEYPKIWRNVGNSRFALVPDAGPFFAAKHAARGASFGDIDNDGDLDVVVCLRDHRPAVLLNETPRRGWIRLELISQFSRGPAIGARVSVHAGGRVFHRQVKGGGSYLSANDSRLLIGLNDAKQVELIEVHWPHGGRTTMRNVPIGQSLRLDEKRAVMAGDDALGKAPQ
jgi:hypothetical protein